MASHEQIRKNRQQIKIAAILVHADQTGLLRAELLLDDSGGMLTFRADVSIGGLNQIIQPFWGFR